MVATRSWRGLCLTVKALQLVFLEDDVEDASHAIWVVFSRWVGDDLHPVNGACRDLLEERVLGGPGQSGRPSIDEDWTCDEPRSDTLPSMSTATEGTLTNSSLAVPPAAERSFPTLNTRRSMSISRELASSTTTASSKALMRGLRAMVPAS